MVLHRRHHVAEEGRGSRRTGSCGRARRSGRSRKRSLGQPPWHSEADIALPALARQLVPLVQAEDLHLWAEATMLRPCGSRGCCPACRPAPRSGRSSRDRRCAPGPGRGRRSRRGCTALEEPPRCWPERDVEHLHVHRAHVASDPLFEDVHQEAAVLLASDRAAGDQVALLLVERAGLVAVTPPGLGDLEQLRRGPLDDGDELHEAGPDLIAEVAVDLAPRSPLTAWTVHRMLNSAPALRSSLGPPQDPGVRAAPRPCPRAGRRGCPGDRPSTARRRKPPRRRRPPTASSSRVPLVWMVCSMSWPGRR